MDIAGGTVLLVDMDGRYITEGVLMLILAVDVGYIDDTRRILAVDIIIDGGYIDGYNGRRKRSKRKARLNQRRRH